MNLSQISAYYEGRFVQIRKEKPRDPDRLRQCRILQFGCAKCRAEVRDKVWRKIM